MLRHFSCTQLFETRPGFSVHGIFQARVLEWGAISYSRVSSLPRDRTWVSSIGRQILDLWRHLGSTRMINSVLWMELRDRNWLRNSQSQSMAGLGFELVLGVKLGFSIHFLFWVSVAPESLLCPSPFCSITIYLSGQVPQTFLPGKAHSRCALDLCYLEKVTCAWMHGYINGWVSRLGTRAEESFWETNGTDYIVEGSSGFY